MTEAEQRLPQAYSRIVDLQSTFAYMGSLMTFLAKGSETGGRFALMEFHTKAGNEPPPHVHEWEHECYFVLDGVLRFYCEGKTLDIGPGDFVFLPRGKAHAFNCMSEVVRTLIFVGAAGCESVGLDRYFATMGSPAAGLELPDTAVTYQADDPQHAIRVGTSTGIRILSASETELALPQYPGFGIDVR